MSVPSLIPAGHYEPDQPVVYWDVMFSTTKGGNVVLTASIEDDPNPPIFPALRGQTATTLALRMDQRVAFDLYGKLDVLIRTIGWLPEEED